MDDKPRRPTIGAAVATRLRMAINYKTTDAVVRKRLLRCLPPLVDVIDRACPCVLAFARDGGVYDLCGLPGAPPGILLAAATRRSTTLCECADWPPRLNATTLAWGEMALGATHAIEVADCAVTAASVAFLLGAEGIATQEREAARIVDAGALPMIVVLIADRGRASATLCATLPLPPSLETQLARLDATVH